jgi:protein-tyrosine kinase
MSMDNKKHSVTTITQLMESSRGEAVTAKIMNDETPDNSGLHTSSKVTESADADALNKDSKKISILDKLLANNMLVPGSGLDRRIQDDYRRVKRPLVSNACGRNRSMVERGNIILVTSSIPGEGKTYTSVNLALSISQEMDTTVLLVDCDVAKQGVSRMLGLENVCGLVDVLESDDLSIGDVLLKTDIPNFRVVSAGKQNEYYTELLASHRMSDLVNELASRYSDRVVIFDGPPLLATPQTQVLAGLVGQVVFVVEAGKTPQSLVEEALDMIPKEQATGLLLNKNQGLSRHGYSYYGYYGSEENKSEDAT